MSSRSVLSAQHQHIKFRHLGPQAGLSQATVRAIYQDTFGFMWFGTEDGLNRYDGQRIQVYQRNKANPFSLPGNRIYDLFEDKGTRLWVSTNGGLCYLDRRFNQFQRVYPEPRDSALSFLEFRKDIQGRIWLSAANGGLYLFNPTEDTFQAFLNPISKNYINEFIPLQSGKIWVASSDNSLYEFDPDNGGFRIVLEKQFNEIICFHEDAYQNIWLGTSEAGIRIYQQSTDTWLQVLHDPAQINGLPDNIIWDMTPTQDGQLMIATNNGLGMIDMAAWNQGERELQIFQHESSDPYSLSSNYTFRLFESRNHTIWVGTTDAGLSLWDRNAQKFNHYYQKAKPDALNHNVIWHFEEAPDGKILIGTSRGINLFNPQNGHFRHYVHDPNDSNSLPHNRVWQILHADNQTFWIGTTGGITKMNLEDPDHPNFSTYRPAEEVMQNNTFGTVRQLMIDDQNRLWVGTFWGAYIFDRESETFQAFLYQEDEPNSLSGNSVRCIFQDSQSRIWIGTSSGLNLYREESQDFQHFLHQASDSTSLNDNTVRTICEDQQGRIWAGTSKGLNELIPEENQPGQFHFRSFGIEEGLPNETIYALEVDDDGFIWMSTNNGLSRFDPNIKVFSNFHEHLGLQSHEFNSAASQKLRDGKLLFGGINGFNYFDPNEVSLDQANYPIIFSDIKINYQSIDAGTRQMPLDPNVGKRLNLNFGKDRKFYFEFSVLDLLYADTRQFACRLSPYEKEWNNIGATNNVSYSNIPPGQYKFQVRTASKTGDWSPEYSEVSVLIRPAYWQTWGFRIAVLLVIMGTIFLWYRWRVRSIYQQRMELANTVRERTQQIREQKQELEATLDTLQATQSQLIESEKMASLGQLTAGIAHEINNPINFINGNTEALELDFAEIKELLEELLALKDKTDDPAAIQNLYNKAEELDAIYLVKEVNSLIGGIKRGGSRVAEIVNGLKIYSHSSQEQFQLEDTKVLMESAISILQHKLEKKGIQLDVHFPSLAPIRCHPGKINQVFVNVLDNAIDASKQDASIKIHTSLSNIDEKDFVQIAITDQGMGMDEATKKRVFDPFFTTKEVGKGTGLGMAICLGIIKEHQGRIEIKSEPENGTEILISLPASNT